MSPFVTGKSSEEKMITKKEFPILEFDTEKVAKINPENLFPEKFSADKMIITFCALI